MILFITGGTGFLGKYLLEDLSSKFEKIYVLSRNTFKNDLSRFQNIEILEGDIANPDIFTNIKNRELIKSQVTHIIHGAAFYDLAADHKTSYLNNVVGTQNILSLVKSSKNIAHFYYISTIAVGDDDTFFLPENELPKRSKFKDYYSETKYFAEKMVRETSAQLTIPFTIIRPGIIVGNSISGEIDKNDGPYYFINAFRKNIQILSKIKIAPFSYNPRSKIPIIPVDHCSRLIALIIDREDNSIKLNTFHLISEETPTVHEFLEDLLKTFELNIKFIPVPKNPLHNTLLGVFGIPKEVIPFMFSKISYDKQLTNKALPEILESKYSSYKNALLKK